MRCPVGKQEIRIAAGTDVSDGNILRRHTGFLQNQPVAAPQIQLEFPILLLYENFLFFSWKCFLKDLRDIAAYLIAVPADRGTHGADQILRHGAVFPSHPFYRLSGDFLRGSPPAGMNQTDGAVLRIQQENRNTVRGKYTQHQSRNIGNQSVHIRVIPRAGQSFPGILFRDDADSRGMRLIRKHKAAFLCFKIFRHPAKVFTDILFSVPS